MQVYRFNCWKLNPRCGICRFQNAPVERIGILSGKATDNVNFTLVMGAVMAITEADMSRDERGKLALDLIKRFGSKNPEVSGKLGTYRLDSVDGGRCWKPSEANDAPAR